MNITEDTAQIGNATIRYKLVGEGPILVAPSSLLLNLDMGLFPLAARLTERFTLLMWDHRGIGKSSAPEGPPTIPQMAEDGAALMDHLGIASAAVWGNSMGGMVSQELALRHPDKVERLVLTVTHCGGTEAVQDSAGSEELQEMTPELMTPDFIVDQLVFPLGFPPGFMEEHPETVAEFRAAYMQSPPTFADLATFLRTIASWEGCFDRLGTLKMPVLVVGAELDATAPVENAKMIHEAIPGSRYMHLPGAGHQFDAQYADEVAKEISTFLT